MTHTTTINLHAQPNRGEVDDMIWEVDEDCDGMVSWLEFQTMYTRCAPVYRYMEPCACHTHGGLVIAEVAK